jgi:calcineurin-like phosphoesterase family protein
MNFYISNTHFVHQNIIQYDNRPFSTADETDEALIDRWNDVVSGEDTVYVLGDFSWHREEKTLEIINSLSGHKVLIKGNHDRVSPKIARKFDKVCDVPKTTSEMRKI